MALNVIPSESTSIANAHGIGPEDMQPIRTKNSQTGSAVLDRSAPAWIRRIGQYSNQRVFRERTSRPPAATIATEPQVSCLMVQVGWVKQCYQDVYVKQRDHALSQLPKIRRGDG